ncbi:GbsR/MarR family transcriptional regulator [Nonomuraea endophytica]|uniref:DNA-binding transcriptional regulator GbsR (MarR family) n=1 Tax=Nonomuraea endophytica TaxID=714136 RepID=A0A7W8A5T8_9ACTN|nr:helix-turn-helix domain-containing protein [Nonomuraea endophytica]MBB5080132.1 DNA-binding transcriptional regulator GbsR (MarR family) [Nonomuraea endophytica]
MPGQRLTQQDRRQIAAGLRDGLTYAAIARNLDRPTSTITREVMRNGGPNDYRADQAHRASRQPVRQGSGRSASGRAADLGARDPRVVERVSKHLTELLMQSGLPQMMARVVAALFTTDGGSLTSAELVRRLGVSPASISKAVAYLEEMEIIKRERDPRGRAERYVMDDDVWYQAMLASVRINTLIAEASRSSAQALGVDTPAGTRLDKLGQFLILVSDDLQRSAEHWRHIYAPEQQQKQ